MRGRHEVWFDPATGARERETFGGVVQWESLNASAHGREIYTSLETGYRDALRSGKAKVVGETASVYWIRISEGHDVAVSRDTYRPVSMRVRDMPETRILTYETLRARGRPSAARRQPARTAPASPISLREAQHILGRAPLWTGTESPGASARPRRVALRIDDLLISQSATADDVTTLASVPLRPARGSAPAQRHRSAHPDPRASSSPSTPPTSTSFRLHARFTSSTPTPAHGGHPGEQCHGRTEARSVQLREPADGDLAGGGEVLVALGRRERGQQLLVGAASAALARVRVAARGASWARSGRCRSRSASRPAASRG